ncbi:MAG: YSC84-related protein [Terracidiphilus sp.]
MKATSLAEATKLRAILVALVCASAMFAHATDNSKVSGQQYVRDLAEETLQRLYKAHPAARARVQNAAGYAVFNNTGVKILVAGSGTGKGIAINSRTKKETFMKMVEVQAGLGLGVKKFSIIFVFDNEKVLSDFVNSGWELGGQANASAKTSTKGGDLSGAASVSDGIWMYQMTDKGLSAEITAKGTKYYKDSSLN